MLITPGPARPSSRVAVYHRSLGGTNHVFTDRLSHRIMSKAEYSNLFTNVRLGTRLRCVYN